MPLQLDGTHWGGGEGRLSLAKGLLRSQPGAGSPHHHFGCRKCKPHGGLLRSLASLVSRRTRVQPPGFLPSVL